MAKPRQGGLGKGLGALIPSEAQRTDSPLRDIHFPAAIPVGASNEVVADFGMHAKESRFNLETRTRFDSGHEIRGFIDPKIRMIARSPAANWRWPWNVDVIQANRYSFFRTLAYEPLSDSLLARDPRFPDIDWRGRCTGLATTPS